MTHIALTIAGSDSGGGAGIQADLKTFSALGVYGTSAITALTAQNTQGVTGVHGVPAGFVRQQIDAVYADMVVDAVKIGMLAQADIVMAVAAGLRDHQARNIVVDPVMVATSGDPLLAPKAINALRDTLLPLALVITPNLPEAAALLDEPAAGTEADMERQALRLRALGPQAVLIKGGHGTGNESVDLLVTGDGVMRLAAPRIATRNTHGTGCTLSAAIAAYLARGHSLIEAATAAKAYLTQALAHADDLQIGHGHGPVQHFHALWQR